MRPVPVAKTVLLAIVTLGVYAAVWAYRNAEDLHADHDGFRHWRLLFWIGFPTLGLAWGVLAAHNFVHLNRLRAAVGIPPHASGVWAIVLVWVPLLSTIAALLWARYWNHSVAVLGRAGEPGVTPPLPPALARA